MSDPLDISDLTPWLGAKVRELEILCDNAGLFWRVKTSGARGFLLQAKLYQSQGKNKTAAPAGLSRHHRFFEGLSGAIDIDFDQDKTMKERSDKQARAVALATSIGLVCGASWGDTVHFEQPGLDPWAHYFNLMATLDRQRGT